VIDGVPSSLAAVSTELVSLAHACEADFEPTEALLRLRELMLQIGPVFPSFDPAKIDGPFDRLLAAGGHESAGMLLAGDMFGFMLSRNPAGVVVASAWVPDRSEEQTVRAAEPATALCGALALACAQAIASGPAPASTRVN
jgi:hypothetical protein